MRYKSLPRGPKPAVALQSANAAGAAALQEDERAWQGQIENDPDRERRVSGI